MIATREIDLLVTRAVAHFWMSRDDSARRHRSGAKADAGERSAVTAGKNLDLFVHLVKELALCSGLPAAAVVTGHSPILPGFFRPTKTWDALVIHNGLLIAAVEFKSQGGPSFGNNFNNRCEEALGNATDFWGAFREGAFDSPVRPFLGYVMLLENCPESRATVSAKSPHFPLMPEFARTSYAARYELLCRKLVRENLCSSASLVLSSKSEGSLGQHSSLSEATDVRHFATALFAAMASAA